MSPPRPGPKAHSGDTFVAIPSSDTEGRIRNLEMTAIQRGVRLGRAEETLATHAVVHVHKNDFNRLETEVSHIRQQYVRNSAFVRDQDNRKTHLNLEEEKRRADAIVAKETAEKRGARRFAMLMALISFVLGLATKYGGDYWTGDKPQNPTVQDVRR